MIEEICRQSEKKKGPFQVYIRFGIYSNDRDDAALRCDELKWRISEETAVSLNDGGTDPSQRIIHAQVDEDVQRMI